MRCVCYPIHSVYYLTHSSYNINFQFFNSRATTHLLLLLLLLQHMFDNKVYLCDIYYQWYLAIIWEKKIYYVWEVIYYLKVKNQLFLESPYYTFRCLVSLTIIIVSLILKIRENLKVISLIIIQSNYLALN